MSVPLKAKAVWFCTSNRVLISCLRSVKLGSSKILPAAHTYPSVELVPPGTITASTIMVDAFNDDASFYVVPSYGC